MVILIKKLDNVPPCGTVKTQGGPGDVDFYTKGLQMKKILFASMALFLFAVPAIADSVITETETITTIETVTYEPLPVAPRYVSSVQNVPHRRPCAKRAGAPVRVKTHTEVIDHYQLYQPVTVYQPAGRVVERRVVRAPQSCNKCY